jgi:DNA-binding transcriptional MerR regulator
LTLLRNIVTIFKDLAISYSARKKVIEEFLIGELSVRAGVTLRTIRYYTSEGLLPDPIKRGSRYYYTQDHVDRLKEIDRLKRRYLPLQEIKHLLAVASSEDLQKLLEMQDGYAREKPAQPWDAKKKSDAQEYIDGLLSNPEWDLQKGSIPTRGHRKNVMIDVHQGLESELNGEAWTRIQLIPGVELHVIEALDPKIKILVEELIQHARKLLGRKRGG